MKRILLSSIIILTSLISYSQEQKQDYIRHDPLTLGIETTTITLKTRDEIEQRIEQYNRELEAKFMEREEWVKLLDQCDKLEIISTQDTSQSSSNLGVGKLIIRNTGKTTTDLKPILKKKKK